MEDLYRVLGVSETATEEELKRAYRKLAKRYHPDTHPGDEECKERFQCINEAYEILGNAAKRKEYDTKRKTGYGQQTHTNKQGSAGNGRASYNTTPEMDFANIHKTFEQFFGFNPNNGDIVNEDKLNPKRGANPLDTTAFFEKFMGVKNKR